MENQERLEKIEAELISIKKLIVLAIANSTANQTEIAEVLGVDKSTVSRMLLSKKKHS